MKTAFTELFGIDHPIVSAGMARVSQAPLVAAVSEAGAIGCLGGRQLPRRRPAGRDRCHPPGTGDRSPSTCSSRRRSSITRRLVDGDVENAGRRSPPTSGRELRGIAPMVTPGAVQQQVEVTLDERPAAIVLTFDVPGWFIDACHDRDIHVMALVGSVRAAQQAADAGVDLVVAQGTEGGGHTGHVGTMALVPAVVDAVDVPVLAAGGIVDGRGLAAAPLPRRGRRLDGHAVHRQSEAYGHPAYKRRVVEATSRDTILSRSYTGKPLRTLENAWTRAWADRTDEIQPFPAQYAVAGVRVETGYQDGDVEEGMMPAGQGVQRLRGIEAAGDHPRGGRRRRTPARPLIAPPSTVSGSWWRSAGSVGRAGPAASPARPGSGRRSARWRRGGGGRGSGRAAGRRPG